ncbi:hypothetical protein AB4Z22_46440, partial [Paenibacillus sp. TAF58]
SALPSRVFEESGGAVRVRDRPTSAAALEPADKGERPRGARPLASVAAACGRTVWSTGVPPEYSFIALVQWLRDTGYYRVPAERWPPRRARWIVPLPIRNIGGAA